MIHRKGFDEQLEKLRKLLRQMGEHVSVALGDAITCLQEANVTKAQEIIQLDADLNILEEKIMDLGSNLIITQQPVAKDLRRIIVAFKISGDLERMGDLAVDVAKVTLRMKDQPLTKPITYIPKMSEIVKKMIDESIESFLNEDVDLAYKMAECDHEVDKMYSHKIADLRTFMVNYPHQASQAMLLMLVGRYIERIGDHATNIGESTVYLVTGKRPDLNQ